MISLSIDAEQWNCPLLEGKDSEENKNTSYSREGNEILREIFGKHNIKSTFFVTGFFGEKEPSQIKQLHEDGHEIACHGYHHFWRGNKDLNIKEDVSKSKDVIGNIVNKQISGFRAPQLQYSDDLINALVDEGFLYDSSLNPTYIPGAYNNISQPTNIHKPLSGSNILEIPVAVSPFRLPTGWLFMRLLGINRTIRCCKSLLKKGIAPVIYFHSWELIKINSTEVPFYYTYRTGMPFAKDIDKLIQAFGSSAFTTTQHLALSKKD
ncbi:MAG: polysaccharide deacetylase family protein [Kiritimatiellales bacterium]|nr:polysaccharide deacetylase family protein [Kiritimatiellales bacterium]